jgi:hypothetical protein
MKAMDLPGYAFRGVIWSQWAYWCSLAMAVVAVQVFPSGFTRNAIACLPRLSAIWVNVFGWSVFNLQFTVTMLRSR